MFKPVLVVAGCVALAGCTPTVPVIPVGTITGVIDSVIADAKSICGIEASVSDIAALVGSFIPGVDSAWSVATSICDSVDALSTTSSAHAFGARATRSAAQVALHGKTFTVHFTRP